MRRENWTWIVEKRDVKSKFHCSWNPIQIFSKNIHEFIFNGPIPSNSRKCLKNKKIAVGKIQ